MEDEKEIFRGRVYEIETDIWRQRNVTCEGDLSYLVDSLQPPDRHDKKNEDNVTSTALNPWGKDSKTTTKTYTYIEQEGTPGLVVYQSVAAGTEVEAGTSITYQLSKEPEVIEPDPVIDPDPAVDPNPVTPVDPTPPQPTGNVYNVKLMDSDGAIALQVYLDYTMIYNGTHDPSEGTVAVRITETGSHTVYVYQNGILTAMDKVSY